MRRLVLELGRYGRLVLGRVLEQDESLRSKEGEENLTLWTSSDGEFDIESINEPALRNTGLYILGANTGENGREFYNRFDTREEAVQCIQYIREGVVTINADDKKSVEVAAVPIERIE